MNDIAAIAAAYAAAEAAARDAVEAKAKAQIQGQDQGEDQAQTGTYEEGPSMSMSKTFENAREGEPSEESSEIDTKDESSSKFNVLTSNVLIQRMTTEQQCQHDIQKQMAAAVVAVANAEAIKSRPTEQFVTMAQNGTILGITETITGFPANNLLMTTTFDTMYKEDIKIYKYLKSRFWENGIQDIEIYFRRRTVKGGWMWTIASVVLFIDVPVPGIIVREFVARDIERAAYINKITRLSILLLEMVDSSIAWEKSASIQDLFSNDGDDSDGDKISHLQQLVQLASSREVMLNKPGGESSQITHLPANLDISKIGMDQSDTKLVTLILTGFLKIEDLGALIMNALNSGRKIDYALKGYQTEKEWQKELDKNTPLTTKGLKRGENTLPQLTSLSSTKRSNNTLRRHQNFQNNLKRRCTNNQHLPKSRVPLTPPPHLSSLNLSHTKIGNQGLEMLYEVFTSGSPFLRTLDISFCNIEERGFLAFSRAIRKRKKARLPDFRGLVLSGNRLSYKAAKELGLALSFTEKKSTFSKRSRTRKTALNGYDEDDEDEEYDLNDDDDVLFGGTKGKNEHKVAEKVPPTPTNNDDGLVFLRLACTSLTPESLHELLVGLGQNCPLRELTIPSNNIGLAGTKTLVSFLEGKCIRKYDKKQPVMPKLDQIDLSYNNLGDDGTAELTRAISKRMNLKVNIAKIKLSANGIGAAAIETIMNKLLQHNLVSLLLDNNTIGDRGCQLVAASLPCMHHISRLSLSFNQIGSRGITALMRAVVGCESITSIGVSGNVLKVSGAIAMGFALAQHPRLAKLELENCCLSQVSQCHIVAGIISNRWVPMKKIVGFRVGPPMVAIGGLEPIAHHQSNEDCFRIRRDIQMKNITDQFLTSEYSSNLSDVQAATSESAYLRMLEWLSRIPFDEDELNDLRKYFFDIDGGDSGDGMRGSDGQINLKHRGDLLAALGSKIVEEIRDSEAQIEMTNLENAYIGLSLDDSDSEDNEFVSEVWEGLNRLKKIQSSSVPRLSDDSCYASSKKKRKKSANDTVSDKGNEISFDNKSNEESTLSLNVLTDITLPTAMKSTRRSISSLSQKSTLSLAESMKSTESRTNKARIAMFPPFAAKLELLKSQAQQLMDIEQDPYQQDVIAQQFAEASLTLLRQLRYHCMNNGLDGWRQGKIRRKVLIVDDSIVTRKLVSRAFEKANFTVDTAANGEKGLEKLKMEIYDIAFMDIDMPVMNGFDATKALRDWEDKERPGARQPICALTAAYVNDFERSALLKFKHAGVDVMESKPCNIPRLFKVVDDVSPMFSDLSINVASL